MHLSHGLKLKLATYRVLVLVVAIVLFGVVAGLELRHEYRYAHMVTFQEYAPTWLPPGVHVQGRKVEVLYSPRQDTTDVTLDFHLNSGSRKTTMYEDVSNRTVYDCAGHDDTRFGETCSLLRTPGGQRYQQVTTVWSDDEPVSQSMTTYKGNVEIYLVLQGYPSQPYSQAVLSKIIDSLKPVRYRFLPGRTETACGCGG